MSTAEPLETRPGWRQVRPGLYERVDTPRRVLVSREFADRLIASSGSEVLRGLIERIMREQEERVDARR